MGEYAFFNCGALKTLELYDGIGFWGGGALMNCRSLDTVRLTRISEEQGISLAYFADELSRELDVTVTETDGTAARLIFPEFLEVYEENCPAHHFDYTICGAGISLPPLLPAKKAVLEGIRPALERIFGNGARRGHRPPPLLVAAALPQGADRQGGGRVYRLSPGQRRSGGGVACGEGGPGGAGLFAAGRRMWSRRRFRRV